MNDLIYFLMFITAIAGILVGMLLSFRAGYNAGKGHDNLISDPKIDIPMEIEDEEKAPDHDAIMKDLETSRTIMQGYDLE